jgi:hypothetical protein
MISEFLKSQAQLMGGVVDDSEIVQFSAQLVLATNQKLLS